jgi:hypothetical protein
MRPTTIHTGAWRYPGTVPDANFNLQILQRSAKTLERGRFDAFFMADHLAVLNMPIEALKRSHTVTSFDPLTLLPVLAVATERLGLIATASTTFEQPYLIARRFASLDHISGGRAGWNIVTTSNPDAVLYFGLEEHMEHGERYRRAREFFDVVTGLWDSWSDDAFVRDVASGIYFDPEKLHVLNHKGPYLSVRGPLNIARPVQGWPVIVQGAPRKTAAGSPRRRPRLSSPRVRGSTTGRPFTPTSRAGWTRWAAIAIISRFCLAPSWSLANPSRRRAKSGRDSTASFITRARSHHFRSRSVMMFRVSIPTARCPIFRSRTPTRAAGIASLRLRTGKN